MGIQRDKMKLLKILLGAALVAGQQQGYEWEQPSGGRQGNCFLSSENENQGGRNQGGRNQFQNTEQPRVQPNRGQPNEFEGGARQGQCSPQDFQRTLQTACQNYQNGASAAQAAQPAAYFHFSTGTAGQESRNNPGWPFYLTIYSFYRNDFSSIRKCRFHGWFHTKRRRFYCSV